MSIPLYVSSFVVAWMMAHGANSFLVKKARASAVIKKSFTFASIVFALIALELGGSMMLGTCEEAYTTGIYGLLYVVGISIALFYSVWVCKKIQAMNVESTIDLFEIRYKSPLIRVCASLLSILTTWGLLLGQIIAGKSLIHALGITNEIFFVCLSICTILYAVLGAYEPPA